MSLKVSLLAGLATLMIVLASEAQAQVRGNLEIGSQEEAAEAITFGALKVAGSADCKAIAAEEPIVAIENGKISLPGQISVVKKAGLKRSVCNFALPAQLHPGYRLVLSNPIALGRLSLAKGSKARVSLEIFKTGARGPVLAQEAEAVKAKLNKRLVLASGETVLETACGEELILRGNSSVILSGASAASAHLDLLLLDAVVEKCE